jgi:hypothetical protein
MYCTLCVYSRPVSTDENSKYHNFRVTTFMYFCSECQHFGHGYCYIYKAKGSQSFDSKYLDYGGDYHTYITIAVCTREVPQLWQ